MAEQKKYDKEYKVEAVKLSREIGRKKASEELGVPIGTLYGWVRQAADDKRLTEENELLADASAFFAASRRKSGKTSE